MRLWHKDLIPVLPRQQLLGQWRECCAIVRNISAKGSPNHVLVNRIMDYPMSHFYTYGFIVAMEMAKREYACDFMKFGHYFTWPHEARLESKEAIFCDWHNKKYLRQCYFNLEEKHDCRAISDEEWRVINEFQIRVL